MMIKKLFYLLILFPALVLADGNGGLAGSFLRVGLGARALGMGNAHVAMIADGYGMYYNPAGLASMDDRRFAASYSNMSLDRQFNYIGLALPLPPVAGASVGWINSGVNNLFAYNSSGENVGELNHGLNAIYVSFAARIIALAQADNQLTGLPSDLISIGVSVKYVREGLDDNEEFNYSGSGVGVDLGVQIRPTDWIAIGYQAKDIGSKLASNTSNIFERGADLENKFPVIQRLGVYYRTPIEWVTVAYDFEWSDAGEEKSHMGVELDKDIAVGRFGYDNDHFTIGGGIRFQAHKRLQMILDYAFLDDVSDEGISHVFSWQLVF